MASITKRKRNNTVIGKLLNIWLDQSTQRANNNQCSILWVFKTVIMKVRADSRHKLKDKRFTTAGRKDREYIIPLDKFEQRFFLNCICISKGTREITIFFTHLIILFRDKNRFWVPWEAAVLTIQSQLLLFLSNQSTTQFNSWTDFSHGNEVPGSCDKRPVSRCLKLPSFHWVGLYSPIYVDNGPLEPG